LLGSVHGDRSIHRPRAAADEAYSGSSGAFSVCYRHESSAAFVARDNEIDTGSLAQSVKERQVTFPRYAKYAVDPVGDQSSYQHVCGTRYTGLFSGHFT
jgi:hypothetical protein